MSNKKSNLTSAAPQKGFTHLVARNHLMQAGQLSLFDLSPAIKKGERKLSSEKASPRNRDNGSTKNHSVYPNLQSKDSIDNGLHQETKLTVEEAVADATTIVTDNPECSLSVTDPIVRDTSESLKCDLVTDDPPSDGVGEEENTSGETVKRLAGLPPIEYERLRREEASNLGVRATVLDKEVKAYQKNGNADSNLPFKQIVPWPEEVNPAEVLFDVSEVIRRFIVCDKETSITVALWCAMTWFLDVIQVCPLAIITAPEKRCGKTQLLTVMGRLVSRAITASSISPAALFRAIEAWKPTLLIDEADACVKENEELRGIINSGHTRDSAYVIRTVGDAFTPTKFSTWGPKALSGIGHLADTLMDRAVILELRRKLPHEQVERLRYAEPGLFENLAAKLLRFATDYSNQVRMARPYLPPSLDDRAQDNWEPLLAISKVAGPDWLEIATQTALKVSGTESAAMSIGVELLTDIRDVFEEKVVDRISTTDLINALIKDDEKPWAAFTRGMPIKPRQLATKLKGYGITSKTIRINSYSTSKGFEKKQFEEAFTRYIPSPPLELVTPSQTNDSKGFGVTDRKTTYPFVTHQVSREEQKTKGCDLVTYIKPDRQKKIVKVTI